jgi:uncharacterized delta-60 repeat protein
LVLIWSCLLSCLQPSIAQAQTYSSLVDPTFIPAVNGSFSQVLIQPDGKILLLAAFSGFSDVSINRLLRLSEDGSLEDSFRLQTPVSQYFAHMVLQPDGKVLLGGWSVNSNPQWSGVVTRIRREGAVDAEFRTPIFSSVTLAESIHALALQSDGRIIVGGSFESINAVPAQGIARLNSDGSLDQSFDHSSWKQNTIVRGLSVLATDEILVSGDLSYAGSAPGANLVRLDKDGHFERVPTNSLGFAYVLTTNGTVYTAGNSTNLFRRVLPDLSVDPTFNVSSGSGRPLLEDHAGLLVVGGGSVTVDGLRRAGFFRLGRDGSHDLAFDVGSGVGPSGFVSAVAEDPQGRLIAVGGFEEFDGFRRHSVVRLLTRYGPGPSRVYIGEQLYRAYEDEGKFVVKVAQIGPDSENISVELAPSDGSATSSNDYSFQTTTLVFAPGERVKEIVVPLINDAIYEPEEFFTLSLRNPSSAAVLDAQSTATLNILVDDRIVQFSRTNFVAYEHSGTGRVLIVRHPPDIMDTEARSLIWEMGWNGGTAAPGKDFTPFDGVQVGFVDAGYGNIFPAASFEIPLIDNPTYEGSRTIVVRLRNLRGGGHLGTNQVATLTILDNDTPAGAGKGINGDIFAVAPQPDGRIIVGGLFTKVDGVDRPYFARLQPDTTLDPTFPPGTGPAGPVGRILPQPDGRLLILGSFSSVDGTPRTNIARLFPNGLIDPSFDAGNTSGAAVPALLGDPGPVTLQSDGKILVGGSTDTPGWPGLVRFDAVGGLDETFHAELLSRNGEPTTRAFINALALQTDGKILVGGYFEFSGNTPFEQLLRLNADGSKDSSFVADVASEVVMVEALALDGEHRIWAGGYYGPAPNRQESTGLLRLDTDGRISLIPKLPTQGASRGGGDIIGIKVTAENDLWISWRYGLTGASPDSNAGLARLKMAGTPDQQFLIATSSQKGVTTLVLDTDGKVFAAEGSVLRRVLADGPLVQDLKFETPVKMTNGAIALSLRGQSARGFVVEASGDLQQWEAISTNASPVAAIGAIDPPAKNSQRRFYRARSLP